MAARYTDEISPITIPFGYDILKAETEKKDGIEIRRVGGLLTTASRDMDGQRILGALEKGALDFGPYLANGRWNDCHWKVIDGTKIKVKLTVGYPESVEFQKGKGYYTEGHLITDDPDGQPGPATTMANYYWDLMKAAKRMPYVRRPKVGFSIEGKTLMRAPDGYDVLRARIYHAALAETYKNPDTSADIIKAFYDTDIYRELKNNPSDVDGELQKAVASADTADVIREDLEGAAYERKRPMTTAEKMKYIKALAKQKFPNVPDGRIEKYITDILKKFKKFKEQVNED